jgi:hypothetical protein
MVETTFRVELMLRLHPVWVEERLKDSVQAVKAA